VKDIIRARKPFHLGIEGAKRDANVRPAFLDPIQDVGRKLLVNARWGGIRGTAGRSSLSILGERGRGERKRET